MHAQFRPVYLVMNGICIIACTKECAPSDHFGEFIEVMSHMIATLTGVRRLIR